MLRKNSLRLSHKPSFAARIFYYAHGSVIGRPNSPKTKNKTKLTNNQHGQHCPKLVASEIIKLLKQQMREMARQSLLQAKIRTKELHVIELARWGKYTKTATVKTRAETPETNPPTWGQQVKRRWNQTNYRKEEKGDKMTTKMTKELMIRTGTCIKNGMEIILKRIRKAEEQLKTIHVPWKRDPRVENR
jgi:hypothetical protein